MGMGTKQLAHKSTCFSSLGKAAATAVFGIHLLVSPMITSCKKAPGEEPTLFSNDMKTVATLVSSGTDLNPRNNFGDTPLILAVSRGNNEIAELLITKGADMEAKDRNGWTALMWAINEGNKKIVEPLIANGANVNATDREGRTPLMRAASDGRKEIAELLIAKGADVNAMDAYGRTALKSATAGFTDTGHMQTADVLRKNGATE